MPESSLPPCGRFAPSPTGGLHLGSALAALVAWLSVRSRTGRFIWRVEDIDGPRVVAGAADQQMNEARWLGLDWDEGPDVGGPNSPYLQSERSGLYERSIARLASAQRLFPCTLSRGDLRELASAPHGNDNQPPYPKELRPVLLPDDWIARHIASDDPEAALRFKVAEGTVFFVDLVRGKVAENVAETTGDFVLQRRDGVFAYQLAVVVDDIEMGVTEVVRGEDLLASTARQIQLIEALGGDVPAYAHLPLVVDEPGEKLSKRNAALTLSRLRDDGVRPEAIVGWLAHAVGLLDSHRPASPADLMAHFSWERICSDDIAVPRNLAERLLAHPSY